MNIHIRQSGQVTIVTLAGEIDSRTAVQVEEQLLPLATPGCKILLEMSQVAYLSSAGLRILLLLYRRIASQNGQVVLSGLQEMLRDTMAITGFLDFFEDYSTVDTALTALNHNNSETS
ncbi:MAG: anti-sigma factor antagonist [Anaerolineales bacterium]|nr:anti-sigma factor antagonist [Anaerolineales bacterium]